MRHFIFVLTLLIVSVKISKGQTTPSGFSFQTVVRGADGRLMKNKPVNLVFQILPDENTNVAVWQETRTLITDSYGVATTVIGEGSSNQVTGPTKFGDIQFGQGGYCLKVSLNSATTGPVISKQKFNSVPYARFAEYSNNTFPAGIIMPFGGSVSEIPKGWMLCNGRVLNANDTAGGDGSKLSRLYNVIKTNWGGSGASSFHLPDLRGQFLRGADLGAGADPDSASSSNNGADGKRYAKNPGGNAGSNVGSFQGDQFKSHNHTTAGMNYSGIGYGMCQAGTNRGGGVVVANNGGLGGIPQGPANAVDLKGGSETRPKNAYVLYIIKL